MGWILACTSKRHLVGTPGALNLVAINFLGPCPSLRTPQDDHGPARPGGSTARARLLLDVSNFQDALLQRPRHFLVHEFDIVAFHEMRCPSIALEQLFQFLVRYARKECGVVDLVSIEIENWQYGAVADRVQKFVGVP